MARWFWVLAVCLACVPAAAQERKYAIVSLVGDGLLIVHRVMATGSNLDRNKRELVAVNSPALDNAMVIAIEDAMRARDKAVQTVLMAARDPALFALQSRGLEENTGVAGSVGAGRIEGLGFYLDHHVRVRNTKSGEETQGYIAPFAYFSLSLVDLSTGSVVNQRIVRESFPYSSQQAASPWNALTPEQKVRLLQQLMRSEVRRAVPELVPN